MVSAIKDLNWMSAGGQQCSLFWCLQTSKVSTVRWPPAPASNGFPNKNGIRIPPNKTITLHSTMPNSGHPPSALPPNLSRFMMATIIIPPFNNQHDRNRNDRKPPVDISKQTNKRNPGWWQAISPLFGSKYQLEFWGIKQMMSLYLKCELGLCYESSRFPIVHA